jgi:glycerophosphoryl diester phosphodiesterase
MVSRRAAIAQVARTMLAALALGTATPAVARLGGGAGVKQSIPLVIAHRGASGYLPEHTLAAYFIAVEQGADFIEPDLVMSSDGVLVARHENEISGTTDVAARAQFASRRKRKLIDGVAVDGWFTEDFTLAELKTLRAKERLAELRTGNRRFDAMFEIPTFDEILALVRALETQRESSALENGRPRPVPIGIYPETKHPSYFDGIGLPMEEALVQALDRRGYAGRQASVFIQSFEVSNLRALSRMIRIPLVQLVDARGKPYDFVLNNDPRTYADLMQPKELARIAAYAAAVGVNKDLIIPRSREANLAQPTALVADAHAQGLQVHGWTFRAENAFLPKQYQQGADRAGRGDLAGELEAFLATGMDAFFCDQPDLAVEARDAFVARRRAPSGADPVDPPGSD